MYAFKTICKFLEVLTFNYIKKDILVFDYIYCCYHPIMLNTNFQFLDN